MKHSLILAALLLLAGCNLDEDRKLGGEELADLAKHGADSIVLMMNAEAAREGIIDSFQRISIHVPPLYDKAAFDTGATATFRDLARATGGDLHLLVNSRLIAGEIANIIRRHAADGADLLILMDKTGSMSDDLAAVKTGLSQIIRGVRTHKDVRLAFALYGDKNVDTAVEWFSYQNFEHNYEAAQAFIDTMEVTGGGDWEESVYDGFFEANKTGFWRSGRQRMVILIGDAPPLEKPLSDYTLHDVIREATATGTRMNFYPIVVTPTVDDPGDPAPAVKKFTDDKKLITSLYPNPATNVVNVDFNAEDTYSIEVFSSTGAKVYGESFTGRLWHHDVSSLGNGTYLVRAATAARGFGTSKFVVYR